jgi:aspartyl-tRNA(Asn)/glutamyl-tRNA(Gln) amidotransferase subunit C
MISKQEVQHIANLARLGLSQEEIGEIQQDLVSILGYVEKLKTADVSKVDISFTSGNLKNITREDISKKEIESRREKLLKLTPEEKEGYLKVKRII